MRMPLQLFVWLFYSLSHLLLLLYSISLRSSDFFFLSHLFVLNRKLWLVNQSCLLLDVTLLATCSSFYGPHHLVRLIYIFMFTPNHFALVLFEAAVGVAGDKEVHLPRQEQPEGKSWNHQLHSHVWWGLKPQREGLSFPSKHWDPLHSSV